jgi:Fe-S-cluster-containing hydrogenase component 2
MDPLLGTRIDHSRCISCKMCIMVCPVGGVSVNPTSGEVVMCDLCQGDPECVRACPEHALEYMEAGTITYRRRRAGVDKAVRLLAEATS